MCSIKLQKIMAGKTYPEAGEVLYDMLQKKKDQDEVIILDLEGVASLPSMFLNVSIGKFIKDYGVDLLRQKVSFAKISATQAERIKDYINRVAVE